MIINFIVLNLINSVSPIITEISKPGIEIQHVCFVLRLQMNETVYVSHGPFLINVITTTYYIYGHWRGSQDPLNYYLDISERVYINQRRFISSAEIKLLHAAPGRNTMGVLRHCWCNFCKFLRRADKRVGAAAAAAESLCKIVGGAPAFKGIQIKASPPSDAKPSAALCRRIYAEFGSAEIVRR